MGSSNQTFKYKFPNPFVMPQAFQTNTIPPTGIPRETFFYSASVLEDIMKNIDSEYDARGKTKPTWKAYNAGTDSYSTFKPDAKSGGNLSRVPVKFFPTIVRDIQIAIEALVNDSAYGDSLSSFFVRVFGDNTIHNAKGTWTSDNRIKNGYIVPATNAAGSQELNPLTNILNGAWPFPVDTGNYGGAGHVENPLTRMGIDFHGTQYIKNAKGSLETSATDFPASVIGKKRTAQDVAIVDGQLVAKPGASLEGIDGIELPMIPEGRPGPASRKNEQNTSTGFGKNQYDPDAGYTFLGHHPLVIQQLRWQPPIIEKFDGPDAIPSADYTQKIFSNSTPNINFILSNPMERLWFFNFGQWLVKGRASSSKTGGLTLVASPAQFNGFITTECPFSVFYPPSTVNCSCSQGDTSYAVWGAGGGNETLVWNETAIFQSDSPKTFAKRIGPKTRIRVKHSYSVAIGNPGYHHYYAICVRLNSVAGVNLQPFIPIYVHSGSNPDATLTNFTAVKEMSKETHSDGSVSINIVEAIKKSYPQYSSNGDFVLAIAIFVQQSVSGSRVCGVLDTSGGSVIDSGCSSSLTCTMGTVSSTTNYLQLFEPPFSGINDERLP